MVFKKVIPMQHNPWILVVCYTLYNFLTWILLFRDNRALSAFDSFYPQLVPVLFPIRDYLLPRGLNIIPTFLFAIISIIAFYFYFRSLLMSISLKKTVIFALIFQCITFFSYPILSTDIFTYIMTARISSVYHKNIWIVSPNHFQNDPFLHLSDWQSVTKVYGGVDQLFYILGSKIAGNNLLLNIVIFKSIALFFAILTLYIVYKIANTYYSASSIILRFIFWNPLFILELTGSAHNDTLMFFFMLSAYYVFLKKRYLLSGILFALSVQIKIIPLVLLFFLFGSIFSKKKFSQSFSLLFAFLMTNAVAFFFMRINPVTYLIRILKNNDVYWQSLSTIVAKLNFRLDDIFLYTFIVILAAILVHQIMQNTDPVISYVAAMIIYLVFITSMYWNWYALWFFVFLPFTASPRLIRVGLLFSFTSLLAYPLYWTSLLFNYQSILWLVGIYFFVFIIPVLFIFFPLPHIPVLPKKKIDYL